MSNPNEILDDKKYNKLIVVLSIVIPIVVAVLFGIKIPNVEPLTFLPPIYATINGLTGIILIIAFFAIKNKNIVLHENLMTTAIWCSAVFLIMYVAYHMTSDSTKFGGEGTIKYVYYFILITHILLSIIVIPFVLITYVRAITNNFEKHKKIAKITFPLWLYVAVTGVIVYLMISPYYV
jgi:putative membrane protein